jgi:hypothetical protein
MAALNALPWAYSALVPNASTLTVTAASIDGGRIITAAATLTPTIAVVLPPSPIDGQQFGLTANQSINTLQVTAGTATVSNAPTALTVATTGGSFGYGFRYRASNTTWYRTR